MNVPGMHGAGNDYPRSTEGYTLSSGRIKSSVTGKEANTLDFPWLILTLFANIFALSFYRNTRTTLYERERKVKESKF